MTIEVNAFGGAYKKDNAPTGHIFMRLTMDTSGKIEEGACLSGPNYTGIVVIEYPVSNEESKLAMQHKTGQPPFWWSSKHQRAAEMWMADKQMKIHIAYKNRQQKVRPSGLVEP